jgi:hypothetical protein
MAWVKLDDGFPDHPKLVEAGGDAGWLYVCALAWCNRNLTDGAIPKGILGRLSDRKNPQRLAERLVAAGLWDETDDGWQIHDYTDFQPSRQQVLDERNKARERMRRHRTKPEPSTEPSTDVRANRERTSIEVQRPRPDPTRTEQVTTTTQVSTRPAEGGTDPHPRRHHIATRAAEQQAEGRDLEHRGRWIAKAVRSILDEHGPRIDNLLEWFPTAPDNVIAAAINGETHSLRYYPDTRDTPHEEAAAG